MCDRDDHRHGRGCSPEPRDERPYSPRPDYHTCDQPHTHSHCEADEDEYEEEIDPVDWLRETIEEVTEDAFVELIQDRVRDRLEKVWGQKLDQLTDLVVDHFIHMREMEINATIEEDDLDAKLRDVLHSKD
jgi:hypothetical protein